MSTFTQFSLCSNLLSKLNNNCVKVGIYFCRQPKNDSSAIIVIENTYFQKLWSLRLLTFSKLRNTTKIHRIHNFLGHPVCITFFALQPGH